MWTPTTTYLLWHDLTSEQHAFPMLYISQTPSAIETKPFPSFLAEAPAEDMTHHFGSPQARFHKAMSADAQTNDSPLVLIWNVYGKIPGNNQFLRQLSHLHQSLVFHTCKLLNSQAQGATWINHFDHQVWITAVWGQNLNVSLLAITELNKQQIKPGHMAATSLPTSQFWTLTFLLLWGENFKAPNL